MKFYQKNWFIILMLIIFFPVGLILMWKYAAWNKIAKWIVTGVIAVMAVFAIFTEPEEIEKEEKTTTTNNKEKDTNKAKETKSNDNKKKEKEDKPLTDEERLKKNIKDESVTLKDVEFVDSEDKIMITIEVSPALSKKSTVQAMKAETASTLYALKKTDLDFSTVDIYVSPPDEDHYSMTSRWNYDDVNDLDEDSVYTLPKEMEEKADSFMLNSYFREK